MDLKEKVEKLASMGFEDETEIRRALALSRNDVSLAVARLTSSLGDGNGVESPYYGTSESYEPTDVEMHDITANRAQPRTEAPIGSTSNGWDNQIQYESGSKKGGTLATATTTTLSAHDDDVEFPMTHLYELESRLQAETWTVPIGPNESLGVCLLAATKMARRGLADKDEGCVQFQKFSLHSAFEKLHTSFMVCRWGLDVQSSILTLTIYLIYFICERVRHLPVPVKLLGLLTQVFDPESEFHYKNKAKQLPHSSPFGPNEAYALSPFSAKEACQWLVALINIFGEKGGVHTILKKIEDEKLDVIELSAMLEPFGKCAEFLATPRMKRLLKKSVDKSLIFIESLTEEDFKNKDVGHMSSLFDTLKSLSFYVQVGASIGEIEALRLETSLRMLKTAHFNAKMNALKEIEKLVGEAQSSARRFDGSMTSLRLQQWMVENDVLAIALEGNLHQAQYCERLKKLMEILVPELTPEKLTKIWNIQNGKHPVVAENIHSVMAAVSVKFTTEQLDHLFDLIQQNWSSASDRIREKLVTFVGRIGQADKKGSIATKVLDLLWQLAHLRGLSPEMVKEALDSHIKILSTSTSIKDELRRNYALKCIDNIKKGVSILPSLRHLQEILVGLKSTSQYNERSLVSDLHRQQDLIKMTVVSLVRCHREAVAVAGKRKLDIGIIVIGKYTHGDFVHAHLDFLAYVLNAGYLFIPLIRVKDVWDTLVGNPEACSADREFCFDWLVKGFQDMEPSVQRDLFEQRVLRYSPSQLTLKGYACFKTFFEKVNTYLRKMSGSGTNYPIVEQRDLIGLDYLWQTALDSPSLELAHRVIDHLMHVFYLSVSPRLKSKPLDLHTSFIRECDRRLQDAFKSLASMTPVQHALSTATTMAAAPSSPRVASMNDRFGRLRVIERLLLLAETYVKEVESNVTSSRNYPPHGSTHQGDPLELEIISDSATLTSSKIFVVKTNSNETLISLRRKIASKLKCSVDILQVYYGDRMLLRKQDYMLLHQLNFKDKTFVSAKAGSTFFTQPKKDQGSASSLQKRRFVALEYESQYPGVLICKDPELFTKLYKFSELDDPLISSRVRNLLLLLPDDLAVVQAVNSLTTETSLSDDCDKILRDLFAYNETATSAFKTLYNLEVLASRLLPTAEGISASDSSQFREKFLSVNGHRRIIDVLRRVSPSSSVSPEIRQTCMTVALRITRYLLCGPEAVATAHAAEAVEEADSMEIDFDPSTCPVVTMDDDEFLDTATCVLDVAWAAAVGQFSRDSRGGSEWDETEVEENQKESDIAVMALELFVSCFEMRSQSINLFFELPTMKETIINFLVNSPSEKVRDGAAKQFYRITEILPPAGERNGDLDTPLAKRQRINGEMTSRKFLLQCLISAPLPLWSIAGTVRGAKKKTLERCSEYFDLRCKLLRNLSSDEQMHLGVKPVEMLKEEMSWLDNAIAEPGDRCSETLLAGHLNLVQTLLTCSRVDKTRFDPNFVSKLLDVFLFPASMFRLAGNRPGHSIIPKCRNRKSREAALKLLVTLAEGCPENLEILVGKLIPMHHGYNPEIAKQWDFEPPVAPRALCGFVGIRNGGATCYMNSVIQQLYMQPVIRNTLLSLDDPDMGEDSTFYQMQQVFGHLLDSQLEHFVPEQFWTVFKLWGNPVNIREQQDAFEFFTNLTDQLDEELKKHDRPQIFSKTFGGLFVDQIVCKDCPHRFERRETFWSLQLGIKSSHTLEEALQHFVKGEVLEKDNAYFCEECGEKRDATKRMSIKTLPQLLVIHLKRFGYSWEDQKALKNNDYFRFPWTIDMAPFTAAKVLGNDSDKDDESGSEGSPDHTQVYSMENGSGTEATLQMPYELVGIIVHSGQANAGHYYSFIKDVWEGGSGDWYKFNDTCVEKFSMDDLILETECFGGLFKPKTVGLDSVMRSKNAYMLFYKAVSYSSPLDGSQLSEKERRAAADDSEKDELSELTALVQKGEQSVLFPERMPARIQRAVQDENLRFMQNRDVFNVDYFNFVFNLTSANQDQIVEDSSGVLGVHSLQLAIHFLFNTFFHTERRLRRNLRKWTNLIENLLKSSSGACQWFVAFLGGKDGLRHIKPLLLECPCEERRSAFGHIVRVALESYIFHGGNLVESECDFLLDHLLSLLEKDVADHLKTCSQYMTLMGAYAKLKPPQGVKHLLSKNAFLQFLAFLIGPSKIDVNLSESTVVADNENEAASASRSRRWTGRIVKEIVPLHSALRMMITSCDLAPLCNIPRDEDEDDCGNNSHYFVEEDELLTLPTPVQLAAFGIYRERYMKEVLTACREVATCVDDGIRLACCLSWANWEYSIAFLQLILGELSTLPSNELRPLFQILMSVMLLNDPLKQKRLEYLTRGKENPSLIAIMEESSSDDGRRAYQCVKFLVNLALKCETAAKYLRQNKSRLKWAVKWLNRQMFDYYWNADFVPNVSNESSLSKTLQRTISAQDTLEEANALLKQWTGARMRAESDAASSSQSDSDTEPSCRDDEGEKDKFDVDEKDIDTTEKDEIEIVMSEKEEIETETTEKEEEEKEKEEVEKLETDFEAIDD